MTHIVSFTHMHWVAFIFITYQNLALCLLRIVNIIILHFIIPFTKIYSKLKAVKSIKVAKIVYSCIKKIENEKITCLYYEMQLHFCHFSFSLEMEHFNFRWIIYILIEISESKIGLAFEFISNDIQFNTINTKLQCIATSY